MKTKPFLLVAATIVGGLSDNTNAQNVVNSEPAYRIEHLTFPSSGETLSADLYLPEKKGPFRAVIVTGAWRTVKEQMPAGYAKKMVQRGYAALIFDFRSWGESTGRPRSMENPLAKADDIVAAAKYLSTRTDIIPGSIGGLGICASSGYMAAAATHTDLIRSLALIAPAVPSHATVVATLGGEKNVAALIRSGEAAAEAYKTTGQEKLVPAVEQNTANQKPGADYYTNTSRGKIQEWDNTFNPASWKSWIVFDAQAAASEIKQPLLVVHSDAAASPVSVREFIAKVKTPVTQKWLDNVTQFDFYDQPAPMQEAADLVDAHFSKTLK